MATTGPTQGAERHAATIERWKSRPWLARSLRVAIAVAPLLLSIGFTLGVGRVLPPDRLGMHRWVWIASVFVAANLLLLSLNRLTRRLLPLVALMRLTLVFPDNAPSRTRSALRRSNSRTMLREMEEARARGEQSGQAIHGDYLVQLLKEVNEHDRLTRGHSERVRAYSELLGEEIGLGEDDMHKLRWAALLHDVGKLTVPSEILNKDGRPTDEEWKILSGHPGAGLPMLEPLRPWLGDWIHAADEHHCRWDGNGYPKKVGGTDITLAGRIVAIADAYDVMTSARSYKKPLSPELARQELTSCAGSQFDPTLVKAFLRIGLSRLKTASGPLAWIANLTGSAQIPVPATTAVTNAVVSSGTATVAVMTAAVGGFLPSAPPPPPLDLAFAEQVIVDDIDTTVEATPVAQPTATPDREPAAARPTTEPDATPTPLPTPPPPTPPPPTPTPTPTPTPQPVPDLAVIVGGDAATGPEDTSLLIDVLDNDRDPEGAAVELLSVAEPDHGTAAVVGDRIRYTPPPDFHGTDRFSYRAGDGTTPGQTAEVAVEVTPVNDPPVATVQDRSIPENSDPGTVVAEVDAFDVDGTTPTVTLTGGDPAGRFTIAADGTVTVAAGAVLDHEIQGSYLLRYRVDDGTDPVSVSATVTIADIDEAPVAVADTASTDEDTATTIAVGANDADPEESALTWEVPARSAAGAELAVSGGIVTYTPPPDWSGIDTFTSTAIDSSGRRSVPATATVVVAAVNDAPVAVDDGGLGFATLEDTVLVTHDVTANDSDVEDGQVDAGTVVLISDAAHGTAVHNGDGTFTYTPNRDYFGGDSFTYRVVDAAGSSSAPATVTVGIAAVNDAPVAGDDALSVPNGASATTLDVRLDDTDAENDPLSVVSVTDGAHGTAVHNGDGTITYTHDGSASAADVVSYTVEDPDGAQDTATIQITIDATEDYDAIAPPQDNCPITFNPDQIDTDGDGVGDACDPSPTDSSGGNFTDSFARMGDDDTYGLAAGDIDGDGRVDVVFANHGPNTVWRDGGFFLADTDQALGDAPSEGAVLVDIDGDGDRDLAVANGDGEPNTVWTNDGDGVLADTGQRLGDDHSHDVATADVDGDGDADLIVANATEPSAIWWNDGAGQFTEGGQSLGSGGTEAVAIGDLDGDGDPDLAFAVDGAENQVWFNDGSGIYVDSGQALGPGRGHDVAMGDLDGDGDLDLVFADDNDGDHVWLNDGSGVFTKTGQTLGLGHSRAVVVGDLDGDGDLDIAFGDHTGPNTVWWNDGNAAFTDSGERLGSQKTEGLVLVDVDGDGDYGIITAEVDAPNRMFANF